MILIPKDGPWPQVWRHVNDALKVPISEPLTEIMAAGIARHIQNTGIEATHVLLGCGVKSMIDPAQMCSRMIHGADEMYMGLKVRWVEGSGIELLTDIYKEA